MEIDQILKREFGEGLQTNVPLRNYMTIGTGGVTDYFYIAKTIDQLVKSAQIAYNSKTPFIVMGRGNYLLPSDKGFLGLVIKNETSNIIFSETSSEVLVDSGTSLSRLIHLAAGRDLGGLEFLEGSMNSVGGAIYHNLGNERYSIGDFVKSITFLSQQQGRLVISTQKSIKSSSFKNKSFADEKLVCPIILTVKLQLVRRRKDEILRLLKEGGPFSVCLNENHYMKNVFSCYGYSDPSISLAVEQSGARRVKAGGVAFSNKDSNCIINRKNGMSSDVKKIIRQAKDMVRLKFDRSLEERVEYIGRWDE